MMVARLVKLRVFEGSSVGKVGTEGRASCRRKVAELSMRYNRGSLMAVDTVSADDTL